MNTKNVLLAEEFTAHLKLDHSNKKSFESIRVVNEKNYRIVTLKNSRGAIYSFASDFELNPDGSQTYHNLMKEVFKKNHGNFRATAQKLRECHFEALSLFEEKSKEFNPPLKYNIGDCFFFEGYGSTKGDPGNLFVIYELNGNAVKAIKIDTQEIINVDHLTDYNEKFGIGYYMERNCKTIFDLGFSENEFNSLIIDAVEKKNNYDNSINAASDQTEDAAEVFKNAFDSLSEDEQVEEKLPEVNIVDYSEKAFAVIGDTKPIKEDLKALGGRWNNRLTCGPGWIFSKKKMNEVKSFLKAQ